MELYLRLCSLLVFATVPLVVSEDVVVTTKYGAVRGKRVKTGESGYLDEFYGIPYAAPPVGHLRFQPPEPTKKWNGTREATLFSPACPQPLESDTPWKRFPTSEDCLYLNVYAPKPPSERAVMPVMVWIHGGSYRTGSGAFYNGSELAGTGLVVVTINYRLQALGFLSTLDSACGGNFGLLDQILALKWVKDTVVSFHGDPNDVTIFGESAGSGSVSLLLLSPLAKGQFSKAIMESGVSLSPWAVALPTDSVSPREWAMKLAAKVGCAARATAPSPLVRVPTNSVVDCLRTVPVDKLVRAAEMNSSQDNGIIFRPTVETIFGVIPDTPLKLLRHGAGSDVTSIRGVNKDENSLVFLKVPLSDFTLKNVETQTLMSVQNVFPNNPQAVTDDIMSQYITSKNLSTPEQIREGDIQIQTDLRFVVPTVLELQHVVKNPGHSAQFLYQFTYRATYSNQPVWAGVEHDSELPFVFGQPFTHDWFFQQAYPFPWSPQDGQVSLNVIHLWTNLAKFRNPTPEPIGGVTWSPYTMDKQIYLDIGSSLALGLRLEAERVQFWMSLINTYGGVWA